LSMGESVTVSVAKTAVREVLGRELGAASVAAIDRGWLGVDDS